VTAVLAACSFIFLVLLITRSTSTTSRSVNATIINHLVHPNFDFDHHLAEEQAQREESDRAEERRKGSQGALAEGTDEGEDSEDGEEEDSGQEGGDDEPKVPRWEQVPSQQAPNSLPTALPFLPYSCEACSNVSPLDPLPPICSKYRSQSPKTSPLGTKSFSQSLLKPEVLDHSIMYPGSGADIRRVLKRAMKSSLYGMKRDREGTEGDLTKFQDEEPFRILILGGSGEPLHCDTRSLCS
jgi:hypothetical protein